MRQITPDGKSMRALRALAGTNPGEPLTEYGVWLVARRTKDESSHWHGPLNDLLRRGLAARCGQRGGFEWYITDEGRALLDARS